MKKTNNDHNQIVIKPITKENFQDYGDVIERNSTPESINAGMCERHHDLARIEIDLSGRVGISIFDARIRNLPYEFNLMERHPLGSQAFLPMSLESILVIVAPDCGGKPGQPIAFETMPSQGVNIYRNVWHGVLTPISGVGRLVVIDWIGDADNLKVYEFEDSFCVVRA